MNRAVFWKNWTVELEKHLVRIQRMWDSNAGIGWWVVANHSPITTTVELLCCLEKETFLFDQLLVLYWHILLLNIYLFFNKKTERWTGELVVRPVKTWTDRLTGSISGLVLNYVSKDGVPEAFSLAVHTVDGMESPKAAQGEELWITARTVDYG